MNLLAKMLALVVALSGLLARAENGVTDKEILIGQFAAMSGPAAQLGNACKRACRHISRQ